MLQIKHHLDKIANRQLMEHESSHDIPHTVWYIYWLFHLYFSLFTQMSALLDLT